ncbi:MAG TPA: hypothetical protein VK421_06320 [Pyrinomonadaceae bacterium]|nr:hypothetical protein [Pyrinomonadaceae bacterium]
MEQHEIDEIIYDELGMAGAMVSGSKRARPGQEVVWNANLILDGPGKCWFGDVDLIQSADALQRIAERTGRKVYVLREHDARFETEKNPRLERAVRTFEPSSAAGRGNTSDAPPAPSA